MLIFNEDDSILKLWRQGTPSILTEKETVHRYPIDHPVAFRGMAKRDMIDQCKATGRDFYYIDTGYLGNLGKRKDYHRVVKNDVQHVLPIEVPSDRWNNLTKHVRQQIYKNSWRHGSTILVVTPSEKPCQFYGITRDAWLEKTLKTLKENTDRKIIVRDKPERRKRVGELSIYNQFIEDDVYAVVTYNSIAATEAVAYGIPAFADAPVNAAKTMCLNDFSKIETPYYPDREKVERWLHWLAYCQYHVDELKNGTAYRIQQEYNLC
jgi:hypothetical protein